MSEETPHLRKTRPDVAFYMRNVRFNIPAFLFFLMTVAAPSQERDTLAELKQAQWKHRIILLNNPHQSTRWATSLKKHEAGMKERHLKIIPVDQVLLKKYRITSSEPTLILIGKDGGEKMRQTSKFDLKKVFALIDQMPMRRREMEE